MNRSTIAKYVAGDAQFRELLSGSSVAFGFKVCGSAATFVVTLLMARLFQSRDAGLFFLTIALAEILATVARLGLAQSIIAFVSRFATLEQWSKVKGVFKGSLLAVSSSSILIGLVLLAAAPLAAEAIFSQADLANYLRILAFGILPLSLVYLVGNALKGLGRLRESQFVISFGLQLFLLLGLLVVMHRRTVSMVIWAYVAAAWITAAAALFWWRRYTPRLKALKAVIPFALIIASALPMYWTNLLMIVNARAGIFVLGVLATPTDVFIYHVGLRISMLAGFVLLAVNAYCAPKFAALHARGDMPGLEKTARQATLLTTVATMPLLLVVLIFPEVVLSFFSRELAGHGRVLTILAVGQCVNMASGPVGMLLAMTGHERSLRNIYLGSTAVNLVLQFSLVPALGAGGAAWATTAGVFLVNLAALAAVKSRLGIRVLPGVLPTKTPATVDACLIDKSERPLS